MFHLLGKGTLAEHAPRPSILLKMEALMCCIFRDSTFLFFGIPPSLWRNPHTGVFGGGLLESTFFEEVYLWTRVAHLFPVQSVRFSLFYFYLEGDWSASVIILDASLASWGSDV